MARTTTLRKYTAKQAHALMNGDVPVTKKAVEPSEYKIEKNVPIPSSVRRLVKFPLVKLEVGDSFVVPLKEAQSLRSAIARTHKLTEDKMRFVTRTVTGRGRAGKQLRVWRTA